ncbi:MAG: ABC transporter permease [Vicinamibacteria bacterium]|nr:ABC transporter permease [Vicinamibacteria bacterium]
MTTTSRQISLGTILMTALEALRRNALRSGLTALGIIIGVGAVIVMMAIGDGARQSIESRIRSAGTNLVIVMPGSATVGGARLGQGAMTTLDAADAEALRQVPGVAAVSPGVNTRGQIVASAGNWSTQIQGAGDELATIRSWSIDSGSFFSAGDVTRAAKIAVLGAVVRDQVFGAGTDPTGETVRISNQPFTVIGVLARKGQSATGQDQDDTVIVPYTSVQKRLTGTTHLGSITISAADETQVTSVAQAVGTVLRQRHNLVPGEPDDFTVRTLEEMASVMTSTTTTLSYLLASVAAVSLLVGGIGVTNIMLVSVTERTREIGLRMSLGARRIDVRRQFLVEALVLSLAGGLAGIALGVGAAWVLSAGLHWTTAVSVRAVALSFGCAFAIGAFFGWVPARRAAALNPIDALRYE